MRFKTSEWLWFPNGDGSHSEWPGLTCAPAHMRHDAVAQLFLSNLSDLSSSSMVEIYSPIGTSARYQRTWRPCYVVNTRTWANTFDKLDALQRLGSKLFFWGKPLSMFASTCRIGMPLSDSNRAKTRAPCRAFVSSCWYLKPMMSLVASQFWNHTWFQNKKLCVYKYVSMYVYIYIYRILQIDVSHNNHPHRHQIT